MTWKDKIKSEIQSDLHNHTKSMQCQENQRGSFIQEF